METQKGGKESGKAEAAPAGGQATIRWDDSEMRSVYANVSNVSASREEIVLLFGMNQGWHAAQKEVKIQLADRIIMSPFVAKRLSILLNRVLQGYESKYGPLEIESPPSTESDPKSSPGKK